MTAGLLIASPALAVWLYLIAGRGGFWRASVRDDRDLPAEPARWPDVIAVVPARDEADVIGQSLASLLGQDYPGAFAVLLVDDQSRDGTAAAARQAAAGAAGAAGRLTIVPGRTPPAGWAGKVWAMKQGVDQVDSMAEPPCYLMFTDADIVYARDALRRLVARAESGRLVLTTLMVKLRCETLCEQLFIPAFVFFFQMLYPFAWV